MAFLCVGVRLSQNEKPKRGEIMKSLKILLAVAFLALGASSAFADGDPNLSMNSAKKPCPYAALAGERTSLNFAAAGSSTQTGTVEATAN